MTGQSQWLIETRDLTRIYGDGEQIHALDHVTLHIGKGELVAVMGPSGSGKSTLLNIIGALDRPTEGTILIDGQEMSSLRDLDRFRSQSVGFVFQLHNLLPTLTARENVEVPMTGGSGWRSHALWLTTHPWYWQMSPQATWIRSPVRN